MSFKDVYNSLYTLLVNSTYLSYVDDSMIWKGFRENIPNQNHIIVLEPGNENELTEQNNYAGVEANAYSIDIYARVIIPSSMEASIIGVDNLKGTLEFIDDIKITIKKDLTLGYNRDGSSTSKENASSTFALSSSKRYIAVSINGKTPVGYDKIFCGSATLSGSAIAATIQASLKALGHHADDGYYTATCVWISATNQFVISSIGCGPRSKVTVTAGAVDDCSALLGFDSPTEVVGRNVIGVNFGTVVVDNKLYPVRYRILPLQVLEEVYIN